MTVRNPCRFDEALLDVALPLRPRVKPFCLAVRSYALRASFLSPPVSVCQGCPEILAHRAQVRRGLQRRPLRVAMWGPRDTLGMTAALVWSECAEGAEREIGEGGKEFVHIWHN